MVSLHFKCLPAKLEWISTGTHTKNSQHLTWFNTHCGTFNGVFLKSVKILANYDV